jgi:hypothetical protein
MQIVFVLRTNSPPFAGYMPTLSRILLALILVVILMTSERSLVLKNYLRLLARNCISACVVPGWQFLHAQS